MNTVKQQDKSKLKGVFLVHGDFGSMEAFASALEAEDYSVTIPERDLVYEL